MAAIIRVDSRFFHGPKTGGLSPAAKLAYLQIVALTRDWRYGNRFPKDCWSMVGGQTRKPRDELLQRGLLIDNGGEDWDVVLNYVEEAIVIYRDPVEDWMRNRVLERDGHRCTYCGTTEKLSIDHIFPVSRGGRSTLDNLQVLCRPCNSRKGAKV